ncbi:MAG: DNA-protecting protein DprA [Armatimonadetes bacterium]|nr:DNA-protecting protein DprA [Armatimonadota bacterium]MBS1703122.1 DNA-protecting protein DprA [Armatimonadota bacterium]MBS1727695.1 DNA-protecting protein DprA [Armatimonadota bacterium]
MPIQKGREIAESLDPLSNWGQALLASSLLTESEKRRLSAVLAIDSFAGDIRVLAEDDYPDSLAYASGVPPALLYSGNREAFDQPMVAIVGTRSATSYGRVCARKFAEEFARHGITVVSGGAVGIDAAAHEGTLAAGGSTIAVLACGVDHVYPSAHSGLFQRMKERGLLLSQFAAGTKPADYKFILRNHLIACLSSAVVVIEAPLKSGAIRTAGFAAEQGREVFVVPGPIDQFGFQGSHSLIRDGATLLDHPMQVIESLGIEPRAVQPKAAVQGPAAKILSVLDANSMPVEKIVELTGMEMSEVLAELTILELEGRVIREHGGFAKAL